MNTPLSHKLGTAPSCDEVSHTLNSRKMEISNSINKKVVETSNKSAIDYTNQCIEEMKLTLKLIPLVNHMRNFKKMHFPYKLVNMNCQTRTCKFESTESSRCFLWRIQFLEVPTPSVKTKKIQSEFIE